MYIADKQLVKKRFKKGFKTYNQQASIQLEIAGKLVDLLFMYNLVNLGKVLEIGCGTGFLTEKILNELEVENLVLNDIEPAAFDAILNRLDNYKLLKCRFIPGDAETVGLPVNLDAVLSTSTFQWLNNLESFIVELEEILVKDGLLAFTTYGKDNFMEVRDLIGIGLQYRGLNHLKRALAPSFDIIHAEEWKCKMNFDTPVEVLKHMKNTGVNGLQSSYFGKEKLHSFVRQYSCLYSNDNGGVHLTYHPILIIAKKK